MQTFLFFLVFTIAIIMIIYRIVKYNDVFDISTYILLGIYLPLCLSFFDWSAYHISEKSWKYYYVISNFIIVHIIYMILSYKRVKFNRFEIITNKKIPIEFINIVFFASVLIENYYISGFLIPSFEGLDIHTRRMPIFYFFTTATYVFVVINILEFIATSKKRFIIYAIAVYLFNPITKLARIDSVLALFQIISFLIYYLLSKNNERINNITTLLEKNYTKIISTFLFFTFMVYCGIELGNNRMNSFGIYNLIYANGIAYYGPDFFGEFLTYYYGYFALSFDNLAHNIQYTIIDTNYVGLNTFRSLYFGMLQFDNLFDLNGSAAPRANDIRCAAAAVTTMFWDFYYDFEYFVFVPYIVSFLCAYFLKQRINNNNNSLFSVLLYFYWIPLWLFGSFDNRVYDYNVIGVIIILYIITKIKYKLIRIR